MLGAQETTRTQIAPPIRVRADYVEVDAFVTDGQGRFVRTLSKEDFQVYEDGKRVEVATLELVDLPRATDASRGAERAMTPTDVASNAVPADGRLYFIVLDDLHTSPERSSRTREMALRFIEHNVTSTDLASVVLTSGRPDLSQDFTGNRHALKEAVGRFVGHKVESPAVAKYGGGPPVAVNPGQSSVREGERLWQARAAIETLTYLTTYAASLHGRRKALILISEGMDVDLGAASTPRDLRNMVRDLTSGANRANLSIYAINPRGLSQGGEYAVNLTGSGASQAALQDELKWSIEGLQVLAENTGGRAFVNTSDFGRAFESIDEANSTYYMLTYSSPAPADGKFHKIDVRVTSRDLTVRARNGYVKTPTGAVPGRSGGGPSQELQTALADPRPSGGVVLDASAAVFRSTTGGSSVSALVHVAGPNLAFKPTADRMRANIEFAVVAIDSKGQQLNGDRTTVQMDLSAENYVRAQHDGLVVPFRMDVPPGRYQLRIGARDEASGRIGSLRYDIDVTDFGAAPLAFSSVVVAAPNLNDPPVVRPDSDLQRLLGRHPTLVREFPSGTALLAATEVYTGHAASGDVRVIAEISTAEGRVVWTSGCGTSTPAPAPGVRVCAVDIPLAAIPRGKYSLRFVAEFPPGTNTTSRSLSFVVR